MKVTLGIDVKNNLYLIKFNLKPLITERRKHSDFNIQKNIHSKLIIIPKYLSYFQAPSFEEKFLCLELFLFSLPLRSTS
jgi:hypothetical protein